MTDSVLIIGGTSHIGKGLIPALIDHKINVSSTNRDSLDLNNVPPDLSCLGSHSVVIILAGLTSMRICDENPELSYALNVKAPCAVGSYFMSKGAFCIFASTSAVFNGSVSTPVESEDPNPLTIYGKHKAETEQFFLSKPKQSCVVRMTKVITKDFALFSNWKNALRSNERVQPFIGQSISPISTEFVNESVAKIIKQRVSGICHLSSSDSLSYVEAAHYIARLCNAPRSNIEPKDPPSSPSSQICSLLQSERLSEMGINNLPRPTDALDWWYQENA